MRCTVLGGSRGTPSSNVMGQSASTCMRTSTVQLCDMGRCPRLLLVMLLLLCREPTLTTRTSHFEGCLDYIWLSRGHWEVQSTLEMPYSEPAEAGPPGGISKQELGTCPNKQQPSDHLAIGCEAALLPLGVAAADTGAEARDVVLR